MLGNPINSIDPDGRYTLTGQAAQDAFRDLQNGASFDSFNDKYESPDGWIKNTTDGSLQYDAHVNSQEDAEKYYGNDTEYVGITYQYEAANGKNVQLYGDGSWDYTGSAGVGLQSPTSSGDNGNGLTLAGVSSGLKTYNMKWAATSKMAFGSFDIGDAAKELGTRTKVVGAVAATLNAADYVSDLREGRNSFLSARTALFAGDTYMARMGTSSPQGFILNVGWESGKAAALYKNYLQKKHSPGGLDGLISTDY